MRSNPLRRPLPWLPSRRQDNNKFLVVVILSCAPDAPAFEGDDVRTRIVMHMSMVVGLVLEGVPTGVERKLFLEHVSFQGTSNVQ